MTTTRTVTARTAVTLADELNALYAAGNLATVNGREVLSHYFGAAVARSWQNGTVSVRVRARAKGKTTDLYVKDGQTLTFA